ncbi:MAG: hypothetical protein M1823_002375 [Watsoniomyces obsoletus]|nr:MAG: hypothetical protein M1823_002375 [Watsoniomyces obsoletus]
MSHINDRLVHCGLAIDNIMFRGPIDSRPFRSSSLRKQLQTDSPMVFTSRPRHRTTTSSSFKTAPSTPTTTNNGNDDRVGKIHPPTKPLPWTWSCHKCRQRYPLGVTRRCLEDGHFFCTTRTSLTTGKTIQEGDGRRRCRGKKRRDRGGRSCGSSFDYDGWTAWGAWRREIQGTKESRQKGEKNCLFNCDFPSDCQWSLQFQQPGQKKQEGKTSGGGAVVNGVVTPLATIVEEPEPSEPPELIPSTDDSDSPEMDWCSSGDEDEDEDVIMEDVEPRSPEREWFIFEDKEGDVIMTGSPGEGWYGYGDGDEL